MTTHTVQCDKEALVTAAGLTVSATPSCVHCSTPATSAGEYVWLV